MAKNVQLLQALTDLALATDAEAKKKQLAGLDALIRVDLSIGGADEAANGAGLFRKAVLEQQQIFTNSYGLFDNNPQANDHDFLTPGGTADNNLKALQGLAAKKRIELSMQQAQNNAITQEVLKAITDANNDEELRRALTSEKAKTIFGDLTQGHKWNDAGEPLLTAVHLAAIKKVASDIQTAPIKEKIDPLITQIGELAQKVEEFAEGPLVANNAFLDAAEIAKAKDNLGQLLIRKQTLERHMSNAADLLNQRGHEDNSAKIEEKVRVVQERIAAIKQILTAQIEKLNADIIARKNALVAINGTTATDADLIKAQEHYKAIIDAKDLATLSEHDISYDADEALKAAEKHLAELTRTVKIARITQIKAAFKEIDENDTQTQTRDVTSLDKEEKALRYRANDNAKANQLFQAEAHFTELLSARDKAEAKAKAAPTNTELTTAFNQANEAVVNAEKDMKEMRKQVKANLRMQTAGEFFPGHGFGRPKIAKIGDPLEDTGAIPTASGPTLSAGARTDRYEGVRLLDGYVIRSNEYVKGTPAVPAAPGVRAQPAQPDYKFVLEKDKSGKVTLRTATPAPGQQPIKPSPDQLAVAALRQAKDFLIGYDPKKSPIRIEDCDKEYAQMLHAAILLQKGNLEVDIRVGVSDCDEPQKGMLQTQASANKAFIERTLPADLVKRVRESDTSQFVQATVANRERMHSLKAKNPANGEGLKVGQEEEMKGGEYHRKPLSP